MDKLKGTQPMSVFEMILKGAGGEPMVASALPSCKEIPENWHKEHEDGQLAVDVAQTEKEVVVVSTIAGADADNLEVYIHNDLLTIRGRRSSPIAEAGEEDYFHRECFWGKFSRTIVLPVDVKADIARAEYRNGVLVIRIPKQKTDANVPIVVVEE